MSHGRSNASQICYFSLEYYAKLNSMKNRRNQPGIVWLTNQMVIGTSPLHANNGEFR
jgi:hypothetical protein